jgi:hypothetical protein
VSAEETFKLKLDLETWDGLDSATLRLEANDNAIASKVLTPSESSAEFDITAYLKDGDNAISLLVTNMKGKAEFWDEVKKRNRGEQTFTKIVACKILRNGTSMKEKDAGVQWDASTGTFISCNGNLLFNIKRQKE